MEILDLNSIVRVKLSDYGTKIWLDQAQEFSKYGVDMYKKSLKKFSASIDQDGYLTTSLLNLMNVFGPYVYRNSPFAETIAFVEDDIKIMQNIPKN